MDKKTSFVLYPADFLAAVHNFKKSQIADLKTANVKQNQSKVPTKSKQMCQHPHQMNRRMNRYMYVNL